VEVEGKQRIALARKALTFSKDCADALIILALETTKNEADRVRLFRQALEAGERVLEASPHEEHLPHLWSFLRARPYLRALMGVGLAEWDRGARLAAVDSLSRLLSKSADDPQGARYYLLGWLLDIDDTVLARDLLEGEWEESATWLWADVLLAFKLGGESAARPRLRTAMEENPLVPDAIFDEADEVDEAGTEPPTNLEIEASMVAQHLAEAWTRDLAAFWWLDEEVEAHWPEEVRDALRDAAEAEWDEDGAESDADRDE
jgi:ST7 protein